MIELEKDNLQQILDENPKVFVQFGAAWCGACRMMKPQVKKLSVENEAVQFVYVDAEKFPESRKLAQVDNLPTYATYNSGKVLGQAQGSKLESLKELVNEITSS